MLVLHRSDDYLPLYVDGWVQTFGNDGRAGREGELVRSAGASRVDGDGKLGQKPGMRYTRFVLGLAMISMGASACAPSQTDLHSPSTVVGLDAQGQPANVEQVAHAIRTGASNKGWTVISDEPGVVGASVSSGGHNAVVRIHYTAAGWVIERESSSEGLKYDPDYHGRQIIHHRYNLWVRHLDRAIQNALHAARAAASSTPESTSGGQHPAPAVEPPAVPVPEEGGATPPASDAPTGDTEAGSATSG